jgi:hypothetical protein
MTFERQLRMTSEAAWHHLTEPALMNRWSTAAIESLALGDGGMPGSVGALRRVRLPHRGGVLTEVIDRAEPPHLLEYRVVSGAPVRAHSGIVEIGDDATLRWTVDIEPYAVALVPPIWMLLQWELNRSLNRLAQLDGDGAVPAGMTDASPDFAHELPQLPALRDDAAAVVAAQAVLADELLAAGDPRGHFARVYQYVTEGLLAAVEEGRFDHPGWVLRLIPVFDAYFTGNVRATGPDVEPHWRRAFTTMERVRDGSPFDAMVRTVVAGMRAHIEDDLPRALATVYADHYAGVCEHVRFRADYLRMTDIFPAAGERLMAGLPRWRWAPGALLIDMLAPAPVREQLFERRIYPISRSRSRAFDQAVWIGRLLTA